MPWSSGGRSEVHTDAASIVVGEVTAAGGTSTVAASCWITVVTPGAAVVELGGGNELVVQDGSTATAAGRCPGNSGGTPVTMEVNRARTAMIRSHRERSKVGRR